MCIYLLGVLFQSSADCSSLCKMTDNENKEESRFLYVSDGVVLCCLDLQLNKQQDGDTTDTDTDTDNIKGLPKVSVLNMLKTGKPFSAGLFKLGSQVYTVGGQLLPPGCGDHELLQCRKPWETPHYIDLLRTFGVKGSVCSLYRLSNKPGDSVSLFRCDREFPRPKEPKLWPIVEELNGQLHVISTPPWVVCRNHEAAFSHEYLDLSNPSIGWTKVTAELDELGYGLKITPRFLVVANHIFVATDGDNIWIYDSIATTWKARSIDKHGTFHPLFLTHICHVLPHGFGRCVRELHKGVGLFLVICLVRGDVNPWGYFPSLVAYLVTPTGRVVCFQRFVGFYEEPKPYVFQVAKFINVDKLGKTMCVIADGRFCGSKEMSRHLFIKTFTVEDLPDACSNAINILQQMDDNSVAVEMDFVKVAVKDTYIYRMDDEGDKSSDLPELFYPQACFA